MVEEDSVESGNMREFCQNLGAQHVIIHVALKMLGQGIYTVAKLLEDLLATGSMGGFGGGLFLSSS